jgi:hypothetical protein
LRGWKPVSLIVLLGWFTPNAFAESTGEAIKNFGLVGIWSEDCAKDDEARQTFIVPFIGAPRFAGRNGEPVEILSAVRVTKEKIKIRFLLPAKEKPTGPIEEVFRKEGNQLRIWERNSPFLGNENSGIRNGRWFGSAVGVPRGQLGGEAPLMERCLN